MDIKINYSKAVSQETVMAYKQQIAEAQTMLHNGTGKGNDFLGWLNLPKEITAEHLQDIQTTARLLRQECEVIVVIGIGGSYLGAKAVIDALNNSFEWLQNGKTEIVYAGQNIGEDYLYELQELLKNKKFELKAHQKLFKQMMTTITNQTLQIK